MDSCRRKGLLLSLLTTALFFEGCTSFTTPRPMFARHGASSSFSSISHRDGITRRLLSSSNDTPEKQQPNELSSSSLLKEEDDEEEEKQVAATNTVNQRLLEELEQVTQQEKYGARSSVGKKLGLGKEKLLSEEQQALLEKQQEERLAQVRDLNGVNPWVALGGSLFALGMAAVLWTFTNGLGEFFAMHPMNPESTSYFVLRLSGVFRNVVMGLVSLAAGFFGVTGVGIFFLGVRVLYGVLTGELDPTPIVKPAPTNTKQELELPSVWDLMTGKKKTARGDKKNKIDPFGM